MSATKEARPAAKSRAARGTAGTFCGRRPPSDPEAAAEFAAIRDAYYEMRAEPTASKGRANTTASCEYLQEMKASLADLKAQHPGQPSRWYFQEVHKVRRSRGSGIKSHDEEEKVEKDKEDKGKVEEKVEAVEEVKVEKAEEEEDKAEEGEEHMGDKRIEGNIEEYEDERIEVNIKEYEEEEAEEEEEGP